MKRSQKLPVPWPTRTFSCFSLTRAIRHSISSVSGRSGRPELVTTIVHWVLTFLTVSTDSGLAPMQIMTR